MIGIAPRETIEALRASAGGGAGTSLGAITGALIIDALLSAVSRATSSLCRTEQNRAVRDGGQQQYVSMQSQVKL
jgi:ABC-type branched-subunit amino acid transport system permease subunit